MIEKKNDSADHKVTNDQLHAFQQFSDIIVDVVFADILGDRELFCA